MSTDGAQVIDLNEYRRRRRQRQQEERASRAPAMDATPIVWVPILMWVPCWPMR